jgi:hypothetical protein
MWNDSSIQSGRSPEEKEACKIIVYWREVQSIWVVSCSERHRVWNEKLTSSQLLNRSHITRTSSSYFRRFGVNCFGHCKRYTWLWCWYTISAAAVYVVLLSMLLSNASCHSMLRWPGARQFVCHVSNPDQMVKAGRKTPLEPAALHKQNEICVRVTRHVLIHPAPSCLTLVNWLSLSVHNYTDRNCLPRRWSHQHGWCTRVENRLFICNIFKRTMSAKDSTRAKVKS